MRPSRRLGGVVLIMLSTSGCAAVQSRYNETRRNPEPPTSGRSSGWFGSRFWSRPSAASANSASGTEAAPEPETTRPTTPETDIWTGQRSSGLSRLLPLLGNSDRSRKAVPDDYYPKLSSLSRPAAVPSGNSDRQVRTVSDDEPSAVALSGQPQAPASNPAADMGGVTELLPTPVTARAAVKPHNRPEARGTIALEVEPADLDKSEQAAPKPRWKDLMAGSADAAPELQQPTVGSQRRSPARRESYVIATAASSPTSGGDDPAQPTPSSPQPVLSALTQQPKPSVPKPPAAAPSTAPATGQPPPPVAPSRPSLGPPPPPLESTPSTAPPAESAPVPSTPPPPSAPAPKPPVATPAPVPVPAPEPVPSAEPGPKPVRPGAEPSLPSEAVPPSMPVPTGQAQSSVATPTGVAGSSSQFMPNSAQTWPSPQASAPSAGPASKPHKTCWLLDWFHSLHQPSPQARCQLPPATFPTTYQTCMPGPRPTCQTATQPVQPSSRPTCQSVTSPVQPLPGPTCQTATRPVRPSPQSLQACAPVPCSCAAKAAKASCFSWFHYGMASDFFAKVRSWRHGCSCRCHDSEFRFWRGDCKRCANPERRTA